MEQKELVETITKIFSHYLWEPNWSEANNYLDSMVELPGGEIFHNDGVVDPTGDRPLFSFYVEGYEERFNVYVRHYRFDLDAAGNTIKKPGHSLRHSRPRAFTEAYILPDSITNTRYWNYTARCSWSDNFSRAEGRYWAVKGALEKFGLNISISARGIVNRVKFLPLVKKGPKSGEMREVVFTI